MATATTNRLIVPPSRFARLMGLYGENYWTLTRLLGPQQLAVRGVYESSGSHGFPLRIDLLERARFTLEFKLSYAGFDTPEQRPNPSAHVRFYLDAQVAEVTACHRGSRIEDVLGRGAGSEAVLQHRLRMNVFLQKWLAYLEDCGHWRLGWRPVGRASDCA